MPHPRLHNVALGLTVIGFEIHVTVTFLNAVTFPLMFQSYQVIVVLVHCKEILSTPLCPPCQMGYNQWSFFFTITPSVGIVI
jgi:hypothetical protein